MTTAYDTPVTNDVKRRAALATLHLIARVEPIAKVEPMQCEFCAMVGAVVEARIYAPLDEDYRETCLLCAPDVAAAFRAFTPDGDVLVELVDVEVNR